jgi:hypothetical protein
MQSRSEDNVVTGNQQVVSYLPKEIGPFNEKEPALDKPSIPGLRTVDNDLFTYFVRATWSPTSSKPNGATLFGIQITYAST